MFDRPKPLYVWAEFYLASHLTGRQAVILNPVLYFQKIKRWRITSSFNYSFSLFLHHENARNTVQGNPNILKFSLGSMPPDPPTSLHLHCSHAPPHGKPWLRACLLFADYNFWLFNTRLGWGIKKTRLNSVNTRVSIESSCAIHH